MQSDSDHDRTVERLLRQALKVRASSVSRGPCLDAETMAALADGALTGEELASAQAHASDCSRCQAMLAAIARDDGERDLKPSSLPTPWWRTGRWGWLVPLTAAAAALVLWIAVPRDHNNWSIGQARAPASAAAVSSPKPLEPQQSQKESSTPGGRASRSTLEAGKPGTRAGDRREQTSPREKDEARAEAARSLAKGAGLDRSRAASDTERQSADAVTGSLGDESLKRRPPDAPPVTAQTNRADVERRAQASAAAPPPTLPGAASANQATPARESSTFAAASSPPVEIVSPDRSSRWRPGVAGAVQYSSDGGATWQALATGIDVDLTAGASPSMSVCWLVGRAGTVLLTTDGRRWQRVRFPEAVDLIAVSATDARTAAVTTLDGRRFSTADGGLTWR